MLTSLTLDNFKSFHKATVPLGPFTLLVGTNASGKSNLRDAFRFLHGIGRGYSLAEILGEKYGEGGERVWTGIRGGAREVASGDERRFGIAMEMPWSDKPDKGPYRYRIVVTMNGGLPRVAEESLYAGDKMRFDSHPGGHASPTVDRNLRTIFLANMSFMVVSDVPALARRFESKTESGIVFGVAGEEHHKESVMVQFQSMRFLDLSPDAMRIPSLPGRQVLGDRGENLSSVLLSICEDPAKKEALLEWIRALTPLDVVDLDFPQDFSGRVLVHLVEQGGRKISAHSASDGTLRFVALLAALLDPEGARFYFIEELENGIHPSRLHLLVRFIEQQCKERGVQIVATTHSPWLLGVLNEESRKNALLVYRLEGKPESRIRPILELPDAPRIIESQDLAQLHASGWLEDAAAFMTDQEEEEEEGP